MANPGLVSNFNDALLTHFRLKTKILLVIFVVALGMQICTLTYVIFGTDLVGTLIPRPVVIIAPFTLIAMIVAEYLSLRFIDQAKRSGSGLKNFPAYLVTFFEVSFPTIVMAIAAYFTTSTTLMSPIQLVNSPLIVVYFFMIILSILLLNARLCMFAGIVAGVEYLLINLVLFSEAEFQTDLFNAVAKGAFMVVSGFLAAVISKRIREAITSDLKAKAELIHELDSKVAEKTREVVAQKEEIEQKNKELMDSINYAERIQRSFLATQQMLDKNLRAENYFVLFKPKDVVSGDFYWAAETADGQFILACADSTGHGVPGAIMSLLNITSLEKAVEQSARPDIILNHTRSTIIERLKKDGSADGGKDGMDAALLVFNADKSKLEFSLANNPLWLIRTSRGSGLPELTEYKPDKMPVGKHDKQHVAFTRSELQLHSGDTIFILTDGFADQFGGEKGKKFKYAALKELLLSIRQMPMAEQKNILHKTFEDWKGGLEQVDDVCLIGIRI